MPKREKTSVRMDDCAEFPRDSWPRTKARARLDDQDQPNHKES